MNSAVSTLAKLTVSEKTLKDITLATQLHINRKLFEKGTITQEMYMDAAELFLKENSA